MSELNRQERAEDAAWPYASLLIFGFFGARTPAGRRLVRRTSLALVLLVFSFIMLTSSRGPVLQLAWTVAIPASVALIGWSYARYLHSLDELSRLIQLKAFAWSYGAAMALFFGAAAFAMPGAPGQLEFSSLVYLVVLAEPLRGIALVYNARKYR